MSASSSSTPPAQLTPQSTGAEADAGAGTPADALASLSRKRAVAFYPNVTAANKPQKPFSRSAAKRESVMALGSIEHLQHYFTKTGIAARKDASQQRKGLVPALGGFGHVRDKSSLSSLDLPPSPAIPPPQPYGALVLPPHIRTYETDPENLRPGVIEDLAAVEQMWHIAAAPAPDADADADAGMLSAGVAGGTALDVLGVLKATTRAVRAVRNYLLSLPDEHDAPTARPPTRRPVSRADDPADPLTLIRRAALEVLAVLRALEEAARLPLLDEAYDAQSDHGSTRGVSPDPAHARSPSAPTRALSPDHARALSPADIPRALSPPPNDIAHARSPSAPARVLSPDPSRALSPPPELPRSLSRAGDDASFSRQHVPGRADAILVWEEEEDEFREADDSRGPGDFWDARLVLGSGWLYRQDVTLATVAPERAVVARYLGVVDGVLFRGPAPDGGRGWAAERARAAKRESGDRKGRRASAPGVGEFQARTRRGRRVVSTGVLEGLGGLVLSAEPDAIAEEGEEDEDADAGGATPRPEESEEDGESVDDDELPDWARRGFAGEARTHALLSALLPADLRALLPPADDRAALAEVLASGQLLCAAYNAGVRRSRKPWGYIARDAIHDIAALEAAAAAGGAEARERARGGWTFRRTDNLRLWAAALKIRYMLPLVLPAAPLPSTVAGQGGGANSVRFPKNEAPVHFDAQAVARREDGWEGMLWAAVERWVGAVVEERRCDTR